MAELPVSPNTAAGIFNSVMQILGALMMLHFVGTLLYGIVKWARGKGANGEPVKAEDMKAQKDSFSSETKAKIDSMYEKLNGDKNAKTPETADDALTTAADKTSTLGDQVSSGQLETSVNNLSDNLEALEPYVDLNNPKDPLTQQLETAGDNLGDAWTNFSNNPDLSSAVPTLETQVESIHADVTSLNTSLTKQFQSAEGLKYQQSVDNMTEVETNLENRQKTEENETTDETDGDPKAETGEGLPELDL